MAVALRMAAGCGWGLDVVRDAKDTIFALSSGAVPAGLAVIRVSGNASRKVLESLTGVVPPPQLMKYCRFSSQATGTIDHGLAVFFEAPQSFTGEDVAELHLHGSRAVVARMLEVLSGMTGLRPAEPGEFTLRAFQNGKLDLTEAEALSDLIAADTERQRQLALANASGKSRIRYDAWREAIIELLAEVEAVLDFADEEDAPKDLDPAIWDKAKRLAEDIEDHTKKYRRSEIIRDGFRVAIVGAPNAGKSSLLNAIAGREVAIVTSEAGTTRDLVEADVELAGLLVRFIDTAGIREAEAEAERIGVERSFAAARGADLILLIEDVANPIPVELPARTAELLRIASKADLVPVGRRPTGYDLWISTQSDEGLDRLLDVVESRATESAGYSDAIPFRERHVALLKQCADSLLRAREDQGQLELVAEDFRSAANSIGRLTGRVDVEDLLDVIFSRFCIGK